MPPPASEWITSGDGVEDWALINFALSFDGYAFMQGGPGGEYSVLTSAVEQAFETRPQVLECFNTTGLRCLLFMEQRKAKWEETDRITPYVAAILETIRTRLS